MLNRTSHLSISTHLMTAKTDVITAKISDHHPIIHNGVLFWNVMMQGKVRRAQNSTIVGYNNGFGFVEDDTQYLARLQKVAYVISNLIHRNPGIEVITLCEGPVQEKHVKLFHAFLMQYPVMKKFRDQKGFQKPQVEGSPNWGLLMLANNHYRVSSENFLDAYFTNASHASALKTLANRFQLWKLEHDEKTKYIALGHFPFSGDEHVTEKSQLSKNGNLYCDLINALLQEHTDDHLIVCGDFNLNPHLFNNPSDVIGYQIPINNSILLLPTENNKTDIKSVTVDGVLLSTRERQRFFSAFVRLGLFASLKNEYNLPRHKKSNDDVHNNENAVTVRY